MIYRSQHFPTFHDTCRYRRRSRIGIMVGRLKDRRRVATRYDCCPIACSTGVLAATVISQL